MRLFVSTGQEFENVRKIERIDVAPLLNSIPWPPKHDMSITGLYCFQLTDGHVLAVDSIYVECEELSFLLPAPEIIEDDQILLRYSTGERYLLTVAKPSIFFILNEQQLVDAEEEIQLQLL